MSDRRNLIVFAGLNGAVAIALGAFAAHGVGPDAKGLLTTGSHYQLVHAVFAMTCAIWSQGGRFAQAGGWLGATGGLIFSISLAAIALLNLRFMGAVAPVGGLLMISGWLCATIAALLVHRSNGSQ